MGAVPEETYEQILREPIEGVSPVRGFVAAEPQHALRLACKVIHYHLVPHVLREKDRERCLRTLLATFGFGHLYEKEAIVMLGILFLYQYLGKVVQEHQLPCPQPAPARRAESHGGPPPAEGASARRQEPLVQPAPPPAPTAGEG